MRQIGGVALVALLAACSTGLPSARPEATLPACAQAPPAIATPAELPPNLPLPHGTVLTSVHRSDAGATVIGGYIPAELNAAARFFQAELPEAGYELLGGDAELDEAEAVFAGHGVQGQWKVHSLLDCAAAVSLMLAILADR